MTKDIYEIGIKYLRTNETKHITRQLTDEQYNEFFEAIGIDKKGFQVMYIKPKVNRPNTTMSNIIRRIK